MEKDSFYQYCVVSSSTVHWKILTKSWLNLFDSFVHSFIHSPRRRRISLSFRRIYCFLEVCLATIDHSLALEFHGDSSHAIIQGSQGPNHVVSFGLLLGAAHFLERCAAIRSTTSCLVDLSGSNTSSFFHFLLIYRSLEQGSKKWRCHVERVGGSD